MSDKNLQHLGIIMDGNRRWAKAKSLPGLEGHRVGYETLKTISQACFDRGIKYLTVFAFSTENWSRPKEEVSFLFSLLERALHDELHIFDERQVSLKIIGRKEELPDNLKKYIKEAELKTAGNKSGVLQVAINYGGQQEIVDAVKRIVASGVKPENIDPDLINKNLYNPDAPMPDLIIRTSGEQRLSGFLTWESAYSELMFVDKLWPDFSEVDLDQALEEYKKRERRFGK